MLSSNSATIWRHVYLLKKNRILKQEEKTILLNKKTMSVFYNNSNADQSMRHICHCQLPVIIRLPATCLSLLPTLANLQPASLKLPLTYHSPLPTFVSLLLAVHSLPPTFAGRLPAILSQQLVSHKRGLTFASLRKILSNAGKILLPET